MRCGRGVARKTKWLCISRPEKYSPKYVLKKIAFTNIAVEIVAVMTVVINIIFIYRVTIKCGWVKRKGEC